MFPNWYCIYRKIIKSVDNDALKSLHSKKRYSRIPAKISSRTFGNPKMVFGGKKKVSEMFGNPLRVSDSNKLGNRKKFSRLGNLFFTLENHFWVSEIDKWVSECSGTYFGRYSRIPFFLECIQWSPSGRPGLDRICVRKC
jgi:hypothetical protein